MVGNYTKQVYVFLETMDDEEVFFSNFHLTCSQDLQDRRKLSLSLSLSCLKQDVLEVGFKSISSNSSNSLNYLSIGKHDVSPYALYFATCN